MNARFAVMAAGCLFIGTALADPAKEETAGALPETPHQEEVTREVGSDRFGQLDANHDGSLSQQEGQVESGLVDQWRELDRNHDQRLNVEEFAAFEATKAGSRGKTEAGMPSTVHQEKALRKDALEKPDKEGER